ncbi:tetratricopeptide repeat-containing diguanylate cyclase, partial [Aeromonas sp. HMWF015]|uniref:tetratricopeptide repeat-containing diguanylate cyclase n=2 Tax=Aeromonas sp. HMWF015 TaxID=2056851 RepID=UPI00215A07D7
PDIFYEFYRQKAMVANSMGQYQEAIDELDNAAAQHNELTPVEKGLLQLDRAEALLGLDNYQEAMVQLEQAGIVFQSEIDPLFNSYWHLLMAQGESMTGKYGHALEHLAMAEPTLVREDNQRFLIKLTWLRSQAFEGLGKTADALAQLHRYVELKRAFEQEMQEQSTEWVRSQFELARQEGENKQLRVEQLLQQQELALAKERRFWLLVVMVLCGVLALLTMGWLLDRNRRMRRLAFTDELTGINNRRRVLRQGSDMLAQARRQGSPFCLLVFDIDHFKRINDTLGHHQGDRVLQWVSRAADRQLRHQDQLGRTGGEEFLILLPDTSLEEACRVAERIRHSVANRALPGMSYPVTISIGCASLRDDDQDLAALIQRADNALYRAKEAGRNRVETDN